MGLGKGQIAKVLLFAFMLTHFAALMPLTANFEIGDSMGFSFGIFDADTIEAAFGRESGVAELSAERRVVESAQLKRDWLKLAGTLSWRTHPFGSCSV
ncbi:hypothetical protein OS189_14325 [Sulfitobacter sp. F26169L]|uniref:hypothetical protein n=1 Tax=Sulfitobacter sp. F26169L TaxID=2996015 RepID=UPI002260FDED|nr:hypothetical protein [Sulfitobacter sp. F26169L]MCX7567520.1 hypothetical protein [Sulfitobacter sp. F26169L]